MDRLDEIARALVTLEDAELVEGFLRSILTPTEAEVVSSRWELVKQLRQGKSQRRIARDLGLSLCKITRGSRELKAEGSALRRVVDQYQSCQEETE